ncbi:hypothetical protein BM528_15675 [Alteromonas sp. RW2A1]|uniref:TniQ family protein n=1 Tax=Alteromonas sp. RW2A1 TaxID=1917158 RepID=UPI0009030EA3|nr:TniQ family protein [Alteromonas sp. RW2A1]APE07041.1 hypothetical protein BM528_15675 [Alteromonas sp. RW2A1]
MIQQDASPFSLASLPDEHYLSYLWRWANLSGSRSLYAGLFALTDSRTLGLARALTPQFLASVLERMPEHIDVNAFMLENTPERFFKSLKGTESGFIPLGKNVGVDFANKHLRWCVACAKDDEKSHGLAYWRNSHQDHRLMRCQKHGLRLLKTCHLCKRHKALLTKLGQSPTSARCQYCSKQLENHLVKKLTPFQQWLEQLHHLSNHGVQVDRNSLIRRVQAVVAGESALMKQSPRKLSERPQKRFIDAFNDTKACDHFSFGEVPYGALSSYSQLHLSYVLNPDINHSSIIYALLGWVFLSTEERKASFGTFSAGKAIKDSV